MKKIGFLVGEDKDFINDLIQAINKNPNSSAHSEYIEVGAIGTNDLTSYDVIYDRLSDYVPFFASYLKYVSLKKTKIINKNLLFNQDDSIYKFSLLNELQINCPKVVALPSKQHPAGVNSSFMSNLQFPLDWDGIFNYVGFPAIVKSNHFSSNRQSQIVYSINEFFSIYNLTGNEVQILQEFIEYDEYFRVYSIGNKQKIMGYDPNYPLLSRFHNNSEKINPKLEKKIQQMVQKINKKMGVDFNAIEIGIKEGVPYITEIINSDPYTSLSILKSENYNWLLSNMTEFLLSLAIK